MIKTKFLMNHYQTLGVAYRSTQPAIKIAFRELAKKYHPDQNSDDSAAEQQFRDVKEAYECLSNPLRRAEYDRDWVKTGRVVWTRPSFSSNESVDSDSASVGLSRTDLIIFYSLIIGLPTMAVLNRMKQSDSNSRSIVPTASFWQIPAELPEIFQNDVLVPSFYNPFSHQWERVDDTDRVPSPLELLQFVIKEHRGMYQAKLQSGRLSIPSKKDRFDIVNVPSRVTVASMMHS